MQPLVPHRTISPTIFNMSQNVSLMNSSIDSLVMSPIYKYSIWPNLSSTPACPRKLPIFKTIAMPESFSMVRFLITNLQSQLIILYPVLTSTLTSTFSTISPAAISSKILPIIIIHQVNPLVAQIYIITSSYIPLQCSLKYPATMLIYIPFYV